MDGLKKTYAGDLAVEQLKADTPVGEAAMQTYALRGHPGFAIVAPTGQVIWSATGQLDEAALRAQVERALR